MAKSRARKLADIIVGAGIDIDGNLTFDGGSTSADLTFADNDKANFGDASDLQIYHDGSNSYITDSGAGNLRISGTLLQLNDASFNKYFLGSGSIVRLYYADSEKFATDAQGVNVTGNADISGNMNLLDNGRAHFGNSNDLAIFHDASNSHITSGTGQFFLSSSNSNIWLRGGEGGILNSDGSEYLIRATSNGSVKLYHDNSIKVETFSGGVSVTGQLNATTMHLVDGSTGLQLGNSNDTKFFHDGSNSKITHSGSGGFYIGADTLGLQTGAHNENYLTAAANGAVSLYYDNSAKLATTSTGIDVTGVITTDGMTTSADINFADNAKAVFGAGSDLQIFHDGSHSEISESGTGDLRIRGDSIWVLEADGTNQLSAYSGVIKLYNNGSEKLATTSSGVTVTGTTTSTGATLTGNLDLTYAYPRINLTDTNHNSDYSIINNDGAFGIYDNTNGAYRLSINSSGNVGIGTTSPNTNVQIYHATDDVSINVNHGTGGSYPKKSGISFGAISTSLGGDATFTGGAGIQAINTAAANNPTEMAFFTTSGGSPTERMRIDSSGRVGIGTTSPTETLTLDGDSLTTGTVFLGPNNGSRRPFAKASNWGYSTAYRVAVLGSASNAYSTNITGSTTVSFNYDPSGNSDGSFTGDGREILFRNGTQFVTPNDADNDFNLYNLVLKNGNVGIGTNNPVFPLHVNSSSTDVAKFQTSGAYTYTRFQNSSKTWALSIGSDFGFYDEAASATRMIIDSSGKVGIGTTSADQNLTVRAANAKISAQSTADSQVIGFQARYQNHATLYGSFEYHTADAQLYIDNNFQGNNGVYSNIRFRNCPNGSNTLTDRMIIQGSTGNVGIGTTSPSAALHVDSSNDGPIFDSGGTGNTNHALLVRDSANNQLLRVNNNGNIGIGTTSPSQALHVVGKIYTSGTGGSGYFEGHRLIFEGTGTYANIGGTAYQISNATNEGLVFGRASSRLMTLDTSGNLGIGTASPNSRLNLKLSNRGVSDFRITDSATTNDVLRAGSQADGDGFLQLRTIGGAGPVLFDASGLSYLTGGNFGIGTSNPGSLLQLLGPGSGGSTKTTIGFGTSGWGAPTAPNAALDGGVKLALFEGGTQKVQIGMDPNARLWLSSCGSGAQGVDIYTGSSNTNAPTLRFRVDQGGTTNIYGGLAVTGNIDTSGEVLVGGQNSRFAENNLRFLSAGTAYIDHSTVGQSIDFRASVSSALDTTVLQVNGNGYVYIRGLRISGADGSVNQIWQSTSNAMLGITANGGDINFGQTSSSIMRLKPNGNVGIGTTSPSYVLHVSRTNSVIAGFGDSNTQDKYIRIQNSSGNFELGTHGANGHYLYGATALPIRFYTNGSEKLRITSTGNVGIGTTAPATTLDVEGNITLSGSNGKIYLPQTPNNFNWIGDPIEQTGIVIIPTNDGTSERITFAVDNSEAMRIDSSGRLLVGTTSVNGVNGITFSNTGNATHNTSNTSAFECLTFRVNGTQIGSIVAQSGSSTTYNTSSDQRLKDNIVNAPSASDDIDAIQVRSFDWKADGSHQKYGMVAQELQSVAPEAVSVGETEEEMMGVDYSKLVPMLVKEIQSLRARVAELEGE